jgi:hydroxymethylglutaryl-CoA lyase
VSTDFKVELIRRQIDAGLRRIEVASFVSLKRVPRMADAEGVVARLPRRSGVAYIGVVMNEAGILRALHAGVDELNFVVLATESFNQRNQGASIAESISCWEKMADRVRDAGVKSTITIGAAFGCPFEGEVDPRQVSSIAARVAVTGPTEISLADTIGVGVPSQVANLVGIVREAAPLALLRGHFHNTRNTGFANAYVAVEAGVEALDASLGGIGGCPFAPDATGNIATEDLSYMLQRMGSVSELDLKSLIRNARWLEEGLGSRVPGLLSRAGAFPSEVHYDGPDLAPIVNGLIA